MSLGRMVARYMILLLILLAITTRVHGQFDSNGFLSIDCGLSGTPSYVDSSTELTYVSDEQFVDTGNNYEISSPYSDNYHGEYLTVRSFPSGTRNCYTITSMTTGSNYLIRAIFYYGNYDNLKKPPKFDIYLGGDFWTTVNADSISFPEIVVTSTSDYLHVCLVNTNQGIPFITSLHLRKFLTGMYPYVNSTTSLTLVKRDDLGGSSLARYPDDKFDRWWWSYSHSGWKNISFNDSIALDDDFQTPPAVLRTAVTSSSTQEPLTLLWNSDNSSTTYYFILHFYDKMETNDRRQFNAIVNGGNDNELYEHDGWGWIAYQRSGYTNYTISLVATSISTQPPLLNAFELYVAAPVGLSTYDGDVAAINGVKEHHKIKKGWTGDPCFPTKFLWTGINCTTYSNFATRITVLKLESSKLTGSLSRSIGGLTALEYLYLANNNLSGSLPSTLDNLGALKLLDIRGNPDMLTILPPELEKKRQNGTLDYRFGDYTETNPTISKLIKAIEAVTGLLLLGSIVGVTVICITRKSPGIPVNPVIYTLPQPKPSYICEEASIKRTIIQ